jgi:hypothetical protein
LEIHNKSDLSFKLFPPLTIGREPVRYELYDSPSFFTRSAPLSLNLYNIFNDYTPLGSLEAGNSWRNFAHRGE